jgi:hypothetical protein
MTGKWGCQHESVRVTIDILDPIHRELKRRAAAEGPTMRALILRGVEELLREKRRLREIEPGTRTGGMDG